MKISPTQILLVEDNPDHVLLILRAFKNSNPLNHIYVVGDGQEALDFIYRQGKYASDNSIPRPNLILLDVKLPKLDGFEVLSRIKSDPACRSIPVVMLTTSDKEEEIARGYAFGANSYVTKPIDFDEFRRKVKELNFYWVLLSELPSAVSFTRS